MKNFFRAVRLLLRRPLAAALSVGCSLLVAALWGGNIGMLYPVFEVALRGQSVQQWQAEEIADFEAKLADTEEAIAAVERQAAEDPGADDDAAAELLRLEDRRRRCVESLASRRRWLQYTHWLPDDAFQTVLVMVGVVLVLTMIKNVFLVGNLVSTTWAVQRASVALQRQYMGCVARLDMDGYNRLGVSQLVTNFTETLEHVTRGLHILLGASIREPLKIIACGIGAAIISWRMLLFAMVTAPLAAGLIWLLARGIRRTTNAQVGESIYLNKLVFETISALPVVQAFTMEGPTEDSIHGAARQRAGRTVKASFFIALTKPVVEVLGIASVGAALLCGAYLMINQETHLFGLRMISQPLSIGQMLAFFGLLIGMTDPARKLSETFSVLQVSAAAADRLYAILDSEPTIHEPANPTPMAGRDGGFELRGVGFSYHPDQPVLDGVDLRVEPGETVAVVGRNGSGKSTLVKLLLRFYDAQQGSVEVGGVPVDRASLADLRRHVSIVPQHATLFDDTVAANIRYGSTEATLDQVVAAAKQARAHEFIESQLAAGYETVIGHDGHNLSGGQRQRIALARAILRDPKLLILDEATSQIDLQSEVLMRTALEEFLAGRTCIIVTHRPAFLELADRIVVMERGRVVGFGTPRELLATCPEHRDLYGGALAAA
ncbi:MAG: ABC transporter ATP-binding protein [Planctomycetota bacterium]